MKKNMICIMCPMGCRMEVEMENGKVVSVFGNTCKRGEKYAVEESTAPTRVLTSTVKVLQGKKPLVSAKTKLPIPKDKIFECMKLIKACEVTAPVRLNDVLMENLCGTGISLVSCADVERAE